jgi:hypothetical protein
MKRRSVPLAFVTLTIAMALVLGWQEHRLQDRQHQECLAVLRWVSAAKEQLGMDSRLRPGYQPQWRDLWEYFRPSDRHKLACPAGGALVLGEFNRPAFCTIHGDGVRSPTTAQCHAILWRIDSAKEQDGMDGWKDLGYQMTEAERRMFRVDNLRCPSGGRLRFLGLGRDPYCTLHGTTWMEPGDAEYPQCGERMEHLDTARLKGQPLSKNLLQCPGGGAITVKPVGSSILCSVHGKWVTPWQRG